MSEKITNIVEEVKALTVLELSELVKALEAEFGVSAAATAVAVAGPAAVVEEERQKGEKYKAMLEKVLESLTKMQ